jgi:hypothetical protein
MNDPIGRWGQIHSNDPRFSGDTVNTTMSTATGYPICVPRVAPDNTPSGGDPQCPAGNRPSNGDPRFEVDAYRSIGVPLTKFTMAAPPAPAFGIPAVVCPVPAVVGAPPCVATAPVPPAAPVYPDSRFQMPLMVGDQITYAGSLAKDALGQTYLSAHTITANLGIFTAPGTQPAYVNVEVILLGTGGKPAADNISIEATTRIFVVGFTTDPTNLIDINAIDVDPCTGVTLDPLTGLPQATQLRTLGTVDPLTQPTKSRFRMHVLGGNFMPPTRDMVIVSHVGSTPGTDPFNPAQPALTVGVANGLGSGKFELPQFDFIFAEDLVFGEPLVANNFQDLPFLTQGSGPLGGTGSIVGQLIPWPGSPVAPAPTCLAGSAGGPPIVNAGNDFVVASGLPNELLIGSVFQNPGGGVPTVTWTQTAGPDAGLTQPPLGAQDPSAPTATFTSPVVRAGGAPVSLTFTLTVTDLFGTTTASVNAKVIHAPTDSILNPTVLYKAPAVPKPGALHSTRVGDKGGKLLVTATDSITDPTITMMVVGQGMMQPSVITALPDYTSAPNFSGVAVKPATITIRTSGGSEATIPVP